MGVAGMTDALRDWQLKLAMQLQGLAALKADIDQGLANVAAGRVQTLRRRFSQRRSLKEGGGY